MRSLSFAVGLLTLALAVPAPAAHNTPAKAKQIKTDMVVAYNVCTSPNWSQFQAGVGLPACSPPVPTTENNPTHKVTFGPKGAASSSVAVKGADLALAIKTSDTLDNGSSANGISLFASTASVIATSASCHAGVPPQVPPADGSSCTSQDLGALFSAVFAVPCAKGKCTLKSTVNTILPGTVTAGGLANTQISGIGLADPDHDICFQSGIFTP